MRRRPSSVACIVAIAHLGVAATLPQLGASETSAAEISGQVRYFGSGVPVEGVTIDLVGGATDTTTTAADGTFTFNDVALGNWQLLPSGDLEPSNGVGSLDAAFALLQDEGTISLGSAALLACDVDADGDVDDADAQAILNFRVGGGTLATADTCGSHWVFVPAPAPLPNQTLTPPLISSSSCAPGAVSYEPLSGDATGQDFLAITLGDCTGNWPSGPPPASPTPTSAATQTPTPTQILPTATPDLCAAFGDDFEGGTLDPAWTTLNGGLANVSVAGGALHISPTAAGSPDIWFNSGEGPLIYKALSGDFTVVATVHARSTSVPENPPPPQYRLGGILVLDPTSSVGARNWVHVAVGAGDNSTPIAAEDKTTSTGSSNFLLYALPTADAELRISRNGSIFALYYRQVGSESWILARQHNRPEIPATVWVGLMAYAAGSPANIEVIVDQIDCL